MSTAEQREWICDGSCVDALVYHYALEHGVSPLDVDVPDEEFEKHDGSVQYCHPGCNEVDPNRCHCGAIIRQ